MSTMAQQKVIAWPHKLAEQVGQEAAQEIVEMINQAVATRVDKSEYDAHAQLIDARFDKYEANLKAQIRGALLTGLAWVTVLIFTLYGALYASLQALVK